MADTEKPLSQKLGLKPGLRVSVLGFSDFGFMLDIPFERSLSEDQHYDIILIQVASVEGLRNIRQLTRRLGVKGALWIIYPKGVKSITKNQVMFAGNTDGFTDCKICSFSATHTGLKFLRRRLSTS